MELISSYQNNEVLRNSFFKLAADIFGLNFRAWHDKGYWSDRYLPFSIANGNVIVANVSVNMLDFIIEGKSFRALQIGTVMTHPDYRNQGLSARLMNHILEVFQDQYDFMYLFANESVLDFYPRFGFELMRETQYSMKYTSQPTAKSLRKLDISIKEDLQLIERIAAARVPVSTKFGTANADGITMYHVLNVFTDHLYYFEPENAIVIYTYEACTIHLFDVISSVKLKTKKILEAISDEQTNEVVFHYTPDDAELKFTCRPYEREGALFVKTNGKIPFPEYIKHPVTSEA
jgi:predicted N-acetyltransferase YhbS